MVSGLRRGLMIFLVLFFTGVCLGQAQFWSFDDSLIGKKAPDFNLMTLKSQKQSLTQFRNGQGAIILFWATWCPHCRAAVKRLNQRADEFSQKGVKVALVDIGEDAQTVQAYSQKNRIGYEIFLDEDNSLSDQYGIVGVPTFYFVNKDGVVKNSGHELPENYEELVR